MVITVKWGLPSLIFLYLPHYSKALQLDRGVPAFSVAEGAGAILDEQHFVIMLLDHCVAEAVEVGGIREQCGW